MKQNEEMCPIFKTATTAAATHFQKFSGLIYSKDLCIVCNHAEFLTNIPRLIGIID